MQKIKYLVMDVDGTLTDGKIYMGSDGELLKAFDVKDGYGILDILPSHGIVPIIITGRQSKILEKRCVEIGITRLYQGVNNKQELLGNILQEENGIYHEVAYIGDDINDLSCMLDVKRGGGLIGCPADAVDVVRETADYITVRNGGNGAVREFIEWLIK